VIRAGPLRPGLRLRHVLTALGLAVPAIPLTVIDLAAGVDPYLTVTAARRLGGNAPRSARSTGRAGYTRRAGRTRRTGCTRRTGHRRRTARGRAGRGLRA